jgi:S-adenosylmethionine:tRNA ribosyltransferase-isomerase
MIATAEAYTTKLIEPAPFAFGLPRDLEAGGPPEARGLARDEVRLMVSDRRTDRIEHAAFSDLASFLRPGDLVVANDSATIPAALKATRADGSSLDLHLSTQLDDETWIVEPRKTAVHRNERLALPDNASLQLLDTHRDSRRLWVARLSTGQGALDYLARHGRPIQYPYASQAWPLAAYQTVYARRPGSAEMPSAGRPFSERVIQSLHEKDVGWATLTLHCGVASLETHEAPYDERFEVPPETARAVNETRAAGGRIIAIGTTVVRALESAAAMNGTVIPTSGWTGLIITPQRGVRTVDALLTGLHEPQASHLWMLEAIAGREHLRAAYSEALAERYLWHEFGDVHLII